MNSIGSLFCDIEIISCCAWQPIPDIMLGCGTRSESHLLLNNMRKKVVCGKSNIFFYSSVSQALAKAPLQCTNVFENGALASCPSGEWLCCNGWGRFGAQALWSRGDQASDVASDCIVQCKAQNVAPKCHNWKWHRMTRFHSQKRGQGPLPQM